MSVTGVDSHKSLPSDICGGGCMSVTGVDNHKSLPSDICGGGCMSVTGVDNHKSLPSDICGGASEDACQWPVLTVTKAAVARVRAQSKAWSSSEFAGKRKLFVYYKKFINGPLFTTWSRSTLGRAGDGARVLLPWDGRPRRAEELWSRAASCGGLQGQKPT